MAERVAPLLRDTLDERKRARRAQAPARRRTSVLVGWYDEPHGARSYRRRVEVDIELRERPKGPELSVQAVGGLAYKGTGEFRLDSIGDPLDYHGGQAISELEAVTDFAPGWDRSRRDQLVNIWRRWHLNGMSAECPHQRAIAERMGKEPHAVFATPYTLAHPDRTPSYDAMHGKQITRARVYCPICGYGYGTAWLHEPLPADVLAFAESIINP